MLTVDTLRVEDRIMHADERILSAAVQEIREARAGATARVQGARESIPEEVEEKSIHASIPGKCVRDHSIAFQQMMGGCKDPEGARAVLPATLTADHGVDDSIHNVQEAL